MSLKENRYSIEFWREEVDIFDSGPVFFWDAFIGDLFYFIFLAFSCFLFFCFTFLGISLWIVGRIGGGRPISQFYIRREAQERTNQQESTTNNHHEEQLHRKDPHYYLFWIESSVRQLAWTLKSRSRTPLLRDCSIVTCRCCIVIFHSGPHGFRRPLLKLETLLIFLFLSLVFFYHHHILFLIAFLYKLGWLSCRDADYLHHHSWYATHSLPRQNEPQLTWTCRFITRRPLQVCLPGHRGCPRISPSRPSR